VVADRQAGWVGLTGRSSVVLNPVKFIASPHGICAP